MNEENNKCGSCGKCGHHTWGNVALLLIPVAFLLNAFGVLSSQVVDVAWPILAIIWVAGKFCKCCK